MKIGNLYAQAAAPAKDELFETLHEQAGLIIERIVSSSRIASTTYVQDQDEWVVLLRGQAVLDIEGQHLALAAGDYVFLSSKTPHTVLSVSDGALWLAVHIHPRSPS